MSSGSRRRRSWRGGGNGEWEQGEEKRPEIEIPEERGKKKESENVRVKRK